MSGAPDEHGFVAVAPDVAPAVAAMSAEHEMTDREDRRLGASPLVGRLLRSVRSPMGGFGLAVVVFVVVTALFAPVLAPYDPLGHSIERLASPSRHHLLGTDQYGRDILTRIIYGCRPAVLTGLLSVIVASAVAVPLGLVAGYRGGRIDTIIMRVWDVVLSFPSLILAIALITVIGAGTISTALVIAVASMPVLARLTRSISLRDRQREYVAAARMLGAGTMRIMWWHLLPNVLGPLMVQAATTMAAAVLADAGLSFLGLGTQPPTASWGQMLSDGKSFLFQTPWLGVFPGVAISVTVLGLSLLADGLGRGLDVRR